MLSILVAFDVPATVYSIHCSVPVCHSRGDRVHRYHEKKKKMLKIENDIIYALVLRVWAQGKKKKLLADDNLMTNFI